MRFTVTFKTPQAFEQLDAEINNLGPDDGSDEYFQQKKDLESVFNKFVRYSEYITVEFDTITQTATVVK